MNYFHNYEEKKDEQDVDIDGNYSTLHQIV